MTQTVLPYQPQFSDYRPPADIPNHDGQAIPPTAEFFQTPPAEIGELFSAHSSLPMGKQPMPLIIRLLLLTVIPALVAYGTYYWVQNADRDSIAAIYIMGGAAFLISIPLIAVLTRFRQTCSYVGSNGLVKFTLKGSRAKIQQETFLFAEATELRTGQTRHFINGVYTGTQYHFSWTNFTGKVVRKFKGTYKSKVGIPKQNDAFWLPSAAERAWSIFLLKRMQKELETEGFVHFNLGGVNFVRVGRGFFEFGMKGEVARITNDEIKSLNLNQGQFHIHHKDARWFSSKGKFNFSYATMANARLFLLAMEKLTGYRFG